MPTTENVIAWLAPIASALVICMGQLWLSGQFKRADQKRDDARIQDEVRRRESDKWKYRIESKMSEQDGILETVLEAQCTQMRADITHKIHRYMDDLGCASPEEKESLRNEYEVYCDICSKHKITNHFVERMMEQVLALPDRPPRAN